MFTDDQGTRMETPAEISIEHKLDLILTELKKLEGGMPRDENGDTDYEGHRRFHEEKIKAAKAEAEFWQDLKLEIAKKGVWSLLVVVCGLVMLGISAKFGIGVVVK